MKKKNDPVEVTEQDVAHFPIIFAIIASLLALWISFNGPDRQHSLKFHNPWRIVNAFESAVLAIPVNESLLLVASQNSLRLLKAESGSTSFGFRNLGNVQTYEVSRTSLLGKTRVAKGRAPKLGCGSSYGSLLVSEAGMLLGIHIDSRLSISKAWESPLEDQIVERVSTFDFNGSEHYVVLATTVAQGDPKHVLNALDPKTGTIIWTKSWSDKSWQSAIDNDVNNRFPRDRLDGIVQQIPISSHDLDLTAFQSNRGQILVKWGNGLTIIEVGRGLPPKVVTSSRFSSTPKFPSLARVDLDGDGIPEDVTVRVGLSGCMQLNVYGATRSQLYSNCSDSLDEPATVDVRATGQAYIAVLQREVSHAGAKFLLGNVSVNRPKHRGQALIFWNPSNGAVFSFGANGTILWKSRVSRVEPDDSRIRRRLYVLQADANDNGEVDIIKASTYGLESLSYLLFLGVDEALVLGSADGTLISTFKFSAAIKDDPIFQQGKMVVILENGEIVSVTLKLAHDLVPPLILVPVMLFLCSFWACVMWRRLEDVV